MITKSNTNFLPAYSNPHSISLANTVSNDVNINSPFITKAHNELLGRGMQGLGDSGNGSYWLIGLLVGGLWLLHGKGMKDLGL